MQFGKTGKDSFILDCQFPFSIFQAFALALSAFEADWFELILMVSFLEKAYELQHPDCGMTITSHYFGFNCSDGIYFYNSSAPYSLLQTANRTAMGQITSFDTRNDGGMTVMN